MKLLTVNNLSAGYNGTNIYQNNQFFPSTPVRLLVYWGANGCGKPP